MRYFKIKTKNTLGLVLSTILGLVCLSVIWIYTQTPAGGMDSYNHYLYARWATSHPELIWDQWGKTFFTLPAIPFAKLGMDGMYLLNVICIFVGALFTYGTARKISLRFPWLSVLFYIFQPVVFGNTISALTEPINAMALAVVFYLLSDNRFLWGAFVSGFLPYFRTEGWVLLLGVAVYLIARKKYKTLPFLLLGTLVFCIIGLIQFNSFWWFLSSNPYLKQQLLNADWGFGTWLHYANLYKQIWGISMVLLFVIALASILKYLIELFAKRTQEYVSSFMCWLVWPVFFGFFTAHTVIWVFGMFGSNGLERVFLTIAPASALLALYGLDRILAFEIRKITWPIVTLACISVVYFGYKGANIGWPWNASKVAKTNYLLEQIEKSMTFIKKQGYSQYMLAHQLPVLHVYNNTDPWLDFAKAKNIYLWSVDPDASKDFTPAKTLIIWDGVHAAREGGKPLNVMQAMKRYTPLAFFNDPLDSLHNFVIYRKDTTWKN